MSKMYEECVFCGTGELCILSKELVKFFVQVKAVGKTYHKACLRCMECGTSLHSNKLLDHDGDPFCVRCHSKVLSSTFTLQRYYLFIYHYLKSFMDPKGMDMHCWGRRVVKLLLFVSSYLLFSIITGSICHHSDIVFYTQDLILFIQLL